MQGDPLSISAEQQVLFVELEHFKYHHLTDSSLCRSLYPKSDSHAELEGTLMSEPKARERFLPLSYTANLFIIVGRLIMQTYNSISFVIAILFSESKMPCLLFGGVKNG